MAPLFVRILLSAFLLLLSNLAMGKVFDHAVTANAGIRSSYGLVGAEYAYYPKSNFDIHVGAGLSPATTMFSAGSRFFLPRFRCRILPGCIQFLFFGGDLGFSLPAEFEVEGDGGRHNRYRLGTMALSHLEVGLQSVIGRTLTTTIALGHQNNLYADSEVLRREDPNLENPTDTWYASGTSLRLALGFGF